LGHTAGLAPSNAFTRPHIVVAKSELPQFQGIAAVGLDLLYVSTSETGDIVVESVGGRVTPGTAPMLCMGFLAATPEALSLLEEVSQDFTRWTGLAFPAPVLVERFDALSLLLASNVLRQGQQVAAHATRLARELSLLRNAHEILQNNFAKAEALINQADLAQVTLRFINPPGKQTTGAGRQRIHQTLPASTSGLVALDVHVAKPGGGLAVQLYTLEDHQLQASWVVEADECAAGWVPLILPAGLSGLARTPELVITPLGGVSTLPEFSLGAPQPLPGFRVSADGVARTASLALRCWAGLPGVRLPCQGAMPQPGEAAALVTEIRFPPALRATATPACSAWQTEWPIIRDVPEKNGVFCHPPPSNVKPDFTAAMIQGLTANRPLRISVHGVVWDERAAPVEFALAAAPPGVDVVGRLARGEGGFCFSGWERGTFETAAFIALQVPPHVLKQNLFLLTRMAEGAENYYAQAGFEDLRIAFLGALQPRPAREVTVPVAKLQGVTNPLASEDDGVAYKEHEQAVLCHPIAVGVKLGCIAHLVPAEAIGVSAQVKLGHAQSQPVQFAIAVSMHPGEDVLACLQTGHAEIAYSPWLELQVGETARLELSTESLPLPPEKTNLYLLTRMAPEAPNADWAWAYFQDLLILLPAREVM